MLKKSPAAFKERSSPRKRVLLGGKIVYDDGAFTIDCVIKDISKSGARIVLGRNVSIPANVYLIDLKAGMAHETLVAWRHAPVFGLRFLKTIDLENPPKELLYLERLWNASSGH